jgi:hypothetical protein
MDMATLEWIITTKQSGAALEADLPFGIKVCGTMEVCAPSPRQLVPKAQLDLAVVPRHTQRGAPTAPHRSDTTSYW